MYFCMHLYIIKHLGRQVVVNAGNTGPVRFVDCSFWGPSDSIARLYGTGVTSFESCEFVQWDDKYQKGSPAIDAQAGSIILMVRGLLLAAYLSYQRRVCID